jgi:hypothetical protein
VFDRPSLFEEDRWHRERARKQAGTLNVGESRVIISKNIQGAFLAAYRYTQIRMASKDLTKIEQLDLSKCYHLNILCLAELIELRDLNLSGCGTLNTLNLTGLGRLSYLDLSDCFSLQELKTLGNLRGMHELILNEMHNKLTLPKNIRSRVKIKRIE